MKTIDLRGASAAEIAAALPRPEVDITAALSSVEPILKQVKEQGATALRALSKRFDGVAPANLLVPASALQDALDAQDPKLTAALEVAIENARVAHRAQLPNQSVTEIIPGGFVYQRWVPLGRVGLYVPGGLAVYPSSVVMNVVAAQVAGVPSLVVASPPQKEFGGLPHPSILAACRMLGVTEVIAVGGAQAIGALAYGFTEPGYTCKPVDKVAGPGNIYVAAAKRVVQGVCGIDSEAGTTEIMVLADASANPSYVAADLISQAEHDPAAAAVLVTDSPELATTVGGQITRQVEDAPHSSRIREALSGPQSAIVLVGDIAAGLEVVEAYGPEHLEIVTEDALELALDVKNAGAVFVGDYSPVPLGDYVAGSNHVLPTGGTARYSSGLNSTAYLRSVQVIDYDQDALSQVVGPLAVLANTEGLPSHARAAELRTKGEGRGEAEIFELPLREDLRKVQPYGAPQLDVPVRLNVNENPHPPTEEVVQSIGDAVKEAARGLNRYADRDALALRASLARYIFDESGVTVAADQVWAANGSNEIMLELLQAFGGPDRTVLTEGPTYSMYQEYARDTFTDFKQVWTDDGSFDSSTLIDAMVKWRPAVVFIPSPNNPTGGAVPLRELEEILLAAKTTGPIRSFPLQDDWDAPEPSQGKVSTLVVVDEAYAEFRDPGAPSALSILSSHPNLVVTRTMSKAFAAAGLRLGYMVAAPAVIDQIMRIRLPYHLSLVTQAAALTALDHADRQLEQVDQIRKRRERLASELRSLGLKVWPSQSNFLLFGGLEDRSRTWKRLLDQGVLIREVGPEGALRVTVGTEEENQAFLDALKEAL